VGGRAWNFFIFFILQNYTTVSKFTKTNLPPTAAAKLLWATTVGNSGCRCWGR
jgi:hypothetical protein